MKLQTSPSLNRHFGAAEENLRLGGDFDNIQRKFIGSMFDQNTYDNGLVEALGDKSVGINQAKLSDGAASNVFTDILSKMEGIDMGKLYNGKVSIYNGYSESGSSIPAGFNDPERGMSGPANTAVKGVTAFRGDRMEKIILTMGPIFNH